MASYCDIRVKNIEQPKQIERIPIVNFGKQFAPTHTDHLLIRYQNSNLWNTSNPNQSSLNKTQIMEVDE
ncbi:MAG: hypothetical protein RLO19_16500 [Coleofasciculus sp. G2-EDA-02]